MQNLTRKVDHAVAPKWWSQHDLLKLLKQYDTGLLNGGNFPRDNRQVQGLEMGPNIVFQYIVCVFTSFMITVESSFCRSCVVT